MSQELTLAPLGKAVVTASALRLREQPNPHAPMLSSVPRGQVVEVLGVSPDGLWSQVRAGRRIGWMSRKYLTPETHVLAPTAPREEFAWMTIASAELGVTEKTGALNEPRVLEYLASTNLERSLMHLDSTPWCSAFVNWCVERAGFAGTDSASARSWLSWGRPLTLPRRGAITVLSRHDGGHVGFFIRRDSSRIYLLGGNQANMVSVAGYDETRLLGYRVPS